MICKKLTLLHLQHRDRQLQRFSQFLSIDQQYDVSNGARLLANCSTNDEDIACGRLNHSLNRFEPFRRNLRAASSLEEVSIENRRSQRIEDLSSRGHSPSAHANNNFGIQSPSLNQHRYWRTRLLTHLLKT